MEGGMLKYSMFLALKDSMQHMPTTVQKLDYLEES
jgi:hypothetical protein